MKYVKFILLLFLVGSGVVIVRKFVSPRGESLSGIAQQAAQTVTAQFPLSIQAMRERTYPGSALTIEQTLASKPTYAQYLVSYLSDGYKINALLTVPKGSKPANGWPVIIFNHGYIPPEQYKTTERYVAYVDGFARSGYIVLKSDYRGNGFSEGRPEGAYYSPAYTADVLNAVASIKQYPDADPQRIGMWGHSMGGHITLRSMVISKDIKAGVIWGGVVGNYDQMINQWRRRQPFSPSQREQQASRSGRQKLIEEYGNPNVENAFWSTISPNAYVKDISGPIQLHHGLADDTVPWEFSESLKNELKQAGKPVEYYTYPGADHNLSGSAFGLAMKRSVDFFNTYVKGEK